MKIAVTTIREARLMSNRYGYRPRRNSPPMELMMNRAMRSMVFKVTMFEMHFGSGVLLSSLRYKARR